MMMNKIDNSGMGIASLGRDEDNYLAHVARGEMVVPPIISDDTRQRLYKEMMAVGLDPNEYTVGAGMSINPITGQPEFGFLKKIAKSVKKVVKKVAPIAAVIPGPWQPFAAVYQKGNAALRLAKGEGGLGDILTLGAGGSQSVFGKDGALASIKSGSWKNMGGGFGSALKNIGKVDGKFDPFGYLQERGQAYGQDLKSGFGGIFQGGQGQVTVQSGDTLTKIASDAGVSVQDLIAANPGINPNLIMPGQTINVPGGGGFLGKIGQGIGSILGGGGPTGTEAGSFFGLKTPGYIKGIEDTFLKGEGLFGGGTQTGGAGIGGLFGGMGGNFAIPALTGLAAYMAAKKEEGGLAETPLVTMDPLGRYQLSKALGTGGTREEFGLGPAPQALEFNMGGEARQYFNQGGLAMVKELDMRDGGESSGPGTGTSDDIPAMLSDGEFVMTAKAVRGAGSFTTKKTPQGIELIGGGKSSREQGVKNMRELMNIFEAI